MSRPGRMKERLTIQVNTPAASDYGENADDWSDLETVWGDVSWISASESLRAGQPVGTRAARIVTRFRGTTLGDLLTYVTGAAWTLVSGTQVDRVQNPGRVKPSYRIVYGTRYLEVLGTKNIHEQHRYTEWLAREVAA